MIELPFKMIIETDMEKYRAETFWTKEPETIAWIQSFKDGDTFWDIGANIGIYSFYCASLFPKSNISAFEPDPVNFVRLHQNRLLNEFDNVSIFRFGIGHYEHQSIFYTEKTEAGASGGQMGQPIDEHGKKFNPATQTQTYLVSVDFLIEVMDHKTPTHIKIDIDGQEIAVIAGMLNTIRREELKSVLIEINPNSNKEDIVKLFKMRKFSTINQFNLMENHSRNRRATEGIDVENVVFTR
jgi:FkbM family methyltransferase